MWALYTLQAGIPVTDLCASVKLRVENVVVSQQLQVVVGQGQGLLLVAAVVQRQNAVLLPSEGASDQNGRLNAHLLESHHQIERVQHRERVLATHSAREICNQSKPWLSWSAL